MLKMNLQCLIVICKLIPWYPTVCKLQNAESSKIFKDLRSDDEDEDNDL